MEKRGFSPPQSACQQAMTASKRDPAQPLASSPPCPASRRFSRRPIRALLMIAPALIMGLCGRFCLSRVTSLKQAPLGSWPM